MSRLSIQAVPKFRPKKYTTYAGYLRQQKRAQVLEQMPETFTINVCLMIEPVRSDGRVGKVVLTSTRSVTFQYQVDAMRWSNITDVSWESTISCAIVGLRYFHPAFEREDALFEVLTTKEEFLEPGWTATCKVDSLHLGEDILASVRFPREDYVITEEPDEIDWQKKLATAVRSTQTSKKKKRK